MKTQTHLLSRIPRIVLSLASFAPRLVLLGACAFLLGCPASKPAGDSTAPSPATNQAPKNTVVIRGSNTIGEELAPRLIAEFKKAHAEINFDVETKATGYGMAALRIGQCDIAAASRAAIQVDLDLAKETGVVMSDYLLGYYSVAVVVAGGNPVSNLTREQVRDIFTGKVTNWKEVGGADAEIHVYARDPVSGTHLGFKEVAMNNDAYAAHPKLMTSYAGIADAVGKDAMGIGYSSIQPASASGSKAVTVDGVEANAANVQSGKYPYARALRFYTNKDKESADAKAFVQFVLSTRGQEILSSTGFTPKP